MKAQFPVYFSFFLASLVAKGIMLIFGLTLFAALPTTPPWMTPDSTLTVDAGSPERVYRVTTIMLGQGDDYVFAEDGNPIAAMPSIHMATTFLLLLLLWSRGRLWRSVGIAYTVAMAFLLVYYGEHYVLDELAGIVLAIGGWKLAIRWLGDWSPSLQRRFQRATARGSAPTAQPASPTI